MIACSLTIEYRYCKFRIYLAFLVLYLAGGGSRWSTNWRTQHVTVACSFPGMLLWSELGCHGVFLFLLWFAWKCRLMACSQQTGLDHIIVLVRSDVWHQLWLKRWLNMVTIVDCSLVEGWRIQYAPCEPKCLHLFPNTRRRREKPAVTASSWLHPSTFQVSLRDVCVFCVSL